MSDKDPCVICGITAETLPSTGDLIQQNCPRCGEFKISGTALSMLRSRRDKDFISKLSGWVHDHSRDGAVIDVTSDTISYVEQFKRPGLNERADRLLVEAHKVNIKLGDTVNVKAPNFLAATYSDDISDIFVLLKMLAEKGLMKTVSLGGSAEILPRGYAEVEEMEERLFKIDAGSLNGDGFQWGSEYVRSTPSLADRLRMSEIGGSSNDFSDLLRKGPSLNPDGSFGQVPHFLSPIEPEKKDGLWRLNLNVVPERSVVLSQVTSIKVAEHLAEVNASRRALESLKETLDGFVGLDSTDQGIVRNVQVVPISEEDLQLLRSMVSAAVELEKAPRIPRSVAEFLSGLHAYLIQARAILDNVNDLSGKYTPLLAAIAAIGTVLQLFK